MHPSRIWVPRLLRIRDVARDDRRDSLSDFQLEGQEVLEDDDYQERM
jgi:hypothetical protein